MSVHRGGGVPRSNIFGGGGGGPKVQYFSGGGPAPPPPRNFFFFFFWKKFFFFFFDKTFFFLLEKKIFFFWENGKMATQKMATQKMATQKWRHKVGGRGRYASCGHAGGLVLFLVNSTKPCSKALSSFYMDVSHVLYWSSYLGQSWDRFKVVSY